jgi:hypothetical protein
MTIGVERSLWPKQELASSEVFRKHTPGRSLDKLQNGLGASDLESGRTLAAEYIARYAKAAP